MSKANFPSLTGSPVREKSERVRLKHVHHTSKSTHIKQTHEMRFQLPEATTSVRRWYVGSVPDYRIALEIINGMGSFFLQQLITSSCARPTFIIKQHTGEHQGNAYRWLCSIVGNTSKISTLGNITSMPFHGAALQQVIPILRISTLEGFDEDAHRSTGSCGVLVYAKYVPGTS